jgi:hypothetical protein
MKLPLWPFWDKNHLTGFKKFNLGPNQKILPLFVLKGQRVKQCKKKKQYKLLLFNVTIGRGKTE